MDDGLRQAMVWDTEQDNRNVAAMFAVSALCHVVFFALMVVMPDSFSSSYRMAPQAISVDLVSLPAGPPAASTPPAPAVEAESAPEPEVAPAPPAPAPEPVPLPVPKPDPVPIAPEPKPHKVVKSLKKKTLKTEDAVVQKPAPPPAAKSRSNDVSKAIESMRKKVATQEKTRVASGTAPATGPGTGAGGGGGGGGGTVLSRIENYRIEAALAVAQNWAFSQQLAGMDDQLETLIRFRILPNGEITQIEIVKASGNRYLDDSALRAVKKASPVAPHPEGLGQPYIEVGVRATPSGFR